MNSGDRKRIYVLFFRNYFFFVISEYDFDSDGFCNGTTAPTIMPFTSGTRRSVDWNRKLAFRYRKIKELYSSFRNNFNGISHQFYKLIIY